MITNAHQSPRMKTGFTLVETLVAVAIITLAMVGPFEAVQNALTASYIARDQAIATNLAQEGIEYVRNVRDSNYLYKLRNPGSNRTWLYRFDGTNAIGGSGGVTCITANGCMVDPTQDTTVVCPSGVCRPLNISSSYIYNQSAASGTNIATSFVRKVTLTTVSAYEKRVTVLVTWKTRSTTYSLTVTETLYNWL